MLQAKLILPSCVSSTVRCTSGTGWWRTEHAARKDAALQAYKALHKAGLLSDSLLPFSRQSRVLEDAASKISPVIEGRAQFDPWDSIAKAWAKSEFRQITGIYRATDRSGDTSDKTDSDHTPSLT